VDEYPVNQQSYVVFRPGQGQPQTSVANGGTVPVYLDSQPQLSTTQGALLNVGAITPWTEELPLYVVTPTGAGLIQVTENVVGYWDPYAIAGSLNNQGLPQLIASAISITGAPPLNIVVQLVNLLASVNPSDLAGTTQIFSVVPYMSVRVFWYSGSETAPGLNTQAIALNWFDAQGNNLYTGGSIYGGFDANPYVYQVARANGFLDIVTQPPDGAASMSVSWAASGAHITAPTLLVSGSYRSVTGGMLVRNGSAGLPNTSGTVTDSGLYGYYTMTLAGTGATTDYPVATSGPGVFSCHHNGGGTSTVDVALVDLHSGKRLHTLTTSSGAELSAVAAGGMWMPVCMGGSAVSCFVNVRGTLPSSFVVSLDMRLP
jgi:hypothetical protein